MSLPRSIKYLDLFNHLVLYENERVIEIIASFEIENKYTVANRAGHKLLFMVESSYCLDRIFCGRNRRFEMHVYDNTGLHVMTLYRPYRCFLQRIEVYSPPGKLCGVVQQNCTVCIPLYKVMDASGRETMRIAGPICARNYRDSVFEVTDRKGAIIGKITKEWPLLNPENYGVIKEVFVGFFNILFPENLDTRMKATLIGASLLIDMMFYEDDIIYL